MWRPGGTVVTVGLLLLVIGCVANPDDVTSADDSPSSGQEAASGWDRLRDESNAEYGDRLLQEGQLDSLPDDVDFVRYITTGEYGETYAGCLREQGFDATVTPDGEGLRVGTVPADQSAALAAARYRCRVMYPVHPVFHQPLTDDQLATIYHHQVEFTADCLRREGYDIPTAPSLETFMAQRRGEAGGDIWHPYSGVQPRSEDEWQRINQECPQSPPLTEVYGDIP
jgi:hypothetical protein